MSGDGTTDRGAKPPRTLFSLGRPGPKSTTAEVGADDAAVAADPGSEAVELACGACGATLISGAAFCGECGTPVASLDDEPFDLVEEVPMGDLEDADFGEYVEELPIDDAPGVLYADADAAPALDASAEGGAADGPDGGGATVIAQPAAVLYADPTQPEPLPPAPSGSFEIAAPSYGNADGAIEGADGEATTAEVAAADAAATDETDGDDGIGAAPLVAGAAVGGAVVGSELAAGAAADGAVAASSDAEVLADLASTTDVASGGEVAAESAGSPWSDAPAADAAAATTVAPAADGADAPTTVEPAVVPLAGVAAASAASAAVPPSTPVAGAAYGAGPPPSGDGKSKTGLLVGVAAAVVLVLVVGGIIVAVSSGNKDGAVQTAQTPTTSASTSTTVASTSTSGGPTTTKAGPTTTAPTTSSPASTDTTATTLPTTASTQVPTTPRVTVTQAPPTTVVQAGRIVANPPAGSSVSIPKGGSTTIRLDNVGGSAAGCALTGSSGITVSSDCSPSIPAGATVFVTIQAAAGYEGTSTVTGVLEGAGSYLLTVNVQNG